MKKSKEVLERSEVQTKGCPTCAMLLEGHPDNPCVNLRGCLAKDFIHYRKAE